MFKLMIASIIVLSMSSMFGFLGYIIFYVIL